MRATWTRLAERAGQAQQQQQHRSRFSRWGRRLAWATGSVGAVALTAELTTENSVSRSFRALSAFAQVVFMYKLKTPETAAEYFAMHQFAADSILRVCLANEGLYVKFGQGMNAMSHVLPRQYTDTLKVLLDSAKPVPMEQVRRTIEAETGQRLEELFVSFDEPPVASASIAQVHRAMLRPSGGGDDAEPVPVAVKVRKPCVGKQSMWDIYTFQFFSFVLDRVFGLPTQWSRKTIVDGLKREMDFRIEAANAEKFRHNFRNDPQVYIPTIYHDVSSEKLLVMEWVDAAKILETEKIMENFNHTAVLRKLFDAFGDMVFKHGFVHCDPHAANILVRHTVADAGNAASPRQVPPPTSSSSAYHRNERLSRKGSSSPSPSTQQQQQTLAPTRRSRNDFQIVLLDFGLCVPETERFRMQYALLFKSLVLRDFDTVRRVVADWGISDPEIFASIQMQKPMKAIRAGHYEEVTKEEVRQMQREAHSRMKSFMIDEAKIPRELPMVGRGIDILRGINRMYDSPVNRVNMFVKSAVEALGPLHNYEGVERYIDRVHSVVLRDRGRLHDTHQSSASSGATANAVGEEGEGEYESVYDVGALRLREEQAAAMREISEERNRTLTSRITNDAVSLYRLCLFHIVMCSFSAIHVLTQWYNAALRLLLPAETQRRLHAATFDDRIAERMEESARIT